MEGDFFSDRVWFTYISRIEAEKRLRSNDFISQVCLISASFLLVSTSYHLINNPSECLASTLHLLSILVLVISVFVSGRGFSSRAIYMRQCYENLGRIYAKAREAESSERKEDIEVLMDRYSEVLGISENHSSSDYYWAIIKLKLSGKQCTKSPAFWMYPYVIVPSIFKYVVLILAFFCPIALVLWEG